MRTTLTLKNRMSLLLMAGARIDDQLQGQDLQNYRQDDEIRGNQAEIDRQRYELERSRRQRGEY